MKQLTVVKVGSCHNVNCDTIERDGHFVMAYLDGEIVAGFSTEAIDEFYVKEVLVMNNGK